ncbi:MAG: XRE family transcriptional regulator [Archaeoglobaceae archaeon]
MNVGEKIRELRKKLGISQAELAKRLNIDQTTVSYYEHGKRAITLDMLQRIADALGVNLDYFLNKEEITPVSIPPVKKFIPLYDTNMAAGNGTFPDALEPLRLIPVDTIEADYAFVAHGHSMEPEIHDGDIVLVKVIPPDTVLNGEIVVCIYENQFLVKRFYKSDGRIVLFSDNSEYAPIVVEVCDRFNIVGRVVEIRHIPKKRKLKYQ